MRYEEDIKKHLAKLNMLSESLYNTTANKASIDIFCAEIEQHINLLNSDASEEVVVIIGDRTEELTLLINDFFKSLDKNDETVFALVMEFRHLVGHINVSLINKFNITNKDEQMNTNTANNKTKETEAKVENNDVKQAAEDLIDALKDAKETSEAAATTCGEYWNMTNIAIAGAAVGLVAGAAAFIGYRYGYSAGQEECPVIINVGSME